MTLTPQTRKKNEKVPREKEREREREAEESEEGRSAVESNEKGESLE